MKVKEEVKSNGSNNKIENKKLKKTKTKTTNDDVTIEKTSDLKTIKKSRYLKKNKKKIVEKKDLKIVINLNKCSQNWKHVESSGAIKKKLTNFRNVKPINSSYSLNATRKLEEEAKAKTKEEPKIWFDVDHVFLPEQDLIKTTVKTESTKISTSIATTTTANGDSNDKNTTKTKTEISSKLTKAIAIDCEMVGVGEDGRDSILARVSLVNQLNECIYDKFVIPTENVTDYRTNVSGVRPSDIKKENGAENFEIVQKEVAELIKNRILVGHAVHNDLKILFLDHPKKKLRDTQRCKVFRRVNPSIGGLSSLKNLAQLLLGITIQDGEHSSVQDAQAAMRLYTMYRKEWELEIQSKKVSKKAKETTVSIDEHQTSSSFDDLGKALVEDKSSHQRYIDRKLKRRNKNNKTKK